MKWLIRSYCVIMNKAMTPSHKRIICLNGYIFLYLGIDDVKVLKRRVREMEDVSYIDARIGDDKFLVRLFLHQTIEMDKYKFELKLNYKNILILI